MAGADETESFMLRGGQRPLYMLETISLHPHFASILEDYRKLASEGDLKSNNIRANDYRRWSIVYGLLPDGVDLLDIGVGAGQFANAAARFKRFSRVRGMDYAQATTLQKMEDWELIIHNLTQPPGEELCADVVTCMECIEHIPDPQFSAAVKHLMQMAKKRLIVTVPFLEEPLPRYHKQHFNLTKLSKSFPGCDISLMSTGSHIHWAMVDWRPN